MSKRTVYKEVTHTYKEDVIVSVSCDGCGETKNDLPETWHEFSASHRDWGHESIDSVKEYHACSAECYFKSLHKAIVDFRGNSRTTTIDSFNYGFALKIVQASVEFSKIKIGEQSK